MYEDVHHAIMNVDHPDSLHSRLHTGPMYGIWAISDKTVVYPCRYTALDSTLELFPAIADALDGISTEEEFRSDMGQAAALLKSVTSFEFIYSLTVGCVALGTTKELCSVLQGRNPMHLALSGKWFARMLDPNLLSHRT